jgi:hypothetical protein
MKQRKQVGNDLPVLALVRAEKSYSPSSAMWGAKPVDFEKQARTASAMWGASAIDRGFSNRL